MRPLLQAELPGFSLYDRGKVRDVFAVGEDLLSVATDRIFAFDRVHPGGITGKGRALTACTLWTFGLARDLIGNYVVSSRVEDFPPALAAASGLLAGRSLLVRRVDPIRVECVVRGFLYGQAWKLYRGGGFFWGLQPPGGLRLAEELPEPIFTPARKVRSGEDENITLSDFAAHLGEEKAAVIREASLALYRRLRAEWAKRGFIIADTKFEFGVREGEILLINEAATPDSSRFWRISDYRPGRLQDSWDRDLLESYLLRKKWSPAAPPLPVSPLIRRRLAERFGHLASLVGTGVGFCFFGGGGGTQQRRGAPGGGGPDLTC